MQFNSNIDVMAFVTRRVSIEDVFFITLGDKNSSDLDIYCVTRKSPSFVQMFEYQNRWVEIFVDSFEDMNIKLKNFDEICINFILEMNFFYGDFEGYQKYKQIAEELKKNYIRPVQRRKILQYRIKVISTKLLNYDYSNNPFQFKFLYNSLCYPLTELILVDHKIFPSSPKRWIGQLQSALTNEEFSKISFLYDGSYDLEKIRILIAQCLIDFSFMEVDRSKNNNLTLIT